MEIRVKTPLNVPETQLVCGGLEKLFCRQCTEYVYYGEICFHFFFPAVQKKMHTFKVQENATFFLGENAQDNHKLTQSAGKHTWFFHASHYPSPHGILVCGEKHPEETLARACAAILRSHTHHSQLHVDMISRKYVKLGERMGEVEFLRGPISVWVV